MPRVIPAQAPVQTSSPTSPRSDFPAGEYTSIACPSAGNPSATGFVAAIGVTERKHAPTSVPPELLTIGIRPPPPARSFSQPSGPTSHAPRGVLSARGADRE